ncbi:histone-lysine N-methyltransferase, H3 lysine-79 specific [[Candida] railenensis]|uniref:Histone-lysine N-methyltransferase, H3 lysine-79 specific n=1 Tax=[Candida] railenensis TaxID=45579 RepID=A0A9P0QVP9_9ASCO|nr:histone-lysine N-methyltransferase, H3 lysine-79 specific [[Candida] railenensis]
MQVTELKLRLPENGKKINVFDSSSSTGSSTHDSSSESFHSGLSTPFSSRASPEFESAKTANVNDQKATIDITFSEDLTRSGLLKQYPSIKYQEIKLLAKSNLKVWSQGEILYIFKRVSNDKLVEESELPVRKVSEITKKTGEIARVIDREREIKEGGMDVYGIWTSEETAVLIWTSSYDLTLTTLRILLPNKTPEEIRGKLLQISGNTFWTKPELKYVEKCIQSDSNLVDIARELPVRTQSVVKSKVAYIKKKLQVIRFIEESDDLTRETVVRAYPNLQNLIQFVRKEDITISSELSTGEKKLLAIKAFSQDEDLDQIGKEFPFRSQERVNEELLRLNPDFIKEQAIVNEIDCEETEQKEEEEEEGEEAEELENLEEDANKTSELDIRRHNFKSSVDELVYYAKWFASDKFSSGSRSTRRMKRNRSINEELTLLEEEVENIPKKVVKELTPEEIQARRIKWELTKRKREENERKRKQKIKEEKERRQKMIELGLIIPPKRVPVKSNIEHLKEEAEYFQSVTGNFKPIEEGETRNRKQTKKFEPEFSVSKKVNERQRKKLLQLKLIKDIKKRKSQVKKVKKVKRIKKAKVKVEQDADESEESDEGEEDDDLEVEVDEEEENVVSPFDPYDINTDTHIPLFQRQLFVQEINEYNPYLPELHFVHSSGAIRNETDEIPYIDCMAADVVTKHYKSYNDLPITFPPLMSSNRKEFNPLNKVRLRYLLYPQHSELFILAEPKGEELDPIIEMQKLFQIHFALYFSHSEKIKEIIINDYCRGLDESIENNDFAKFMTIVDMWNTLMIKLSPNLSTESHKFEGDLNEEVRIYLQYDNLKPPSDEDLKLAVFLDEMEYSLDDEEDSPEFEHGPPAATGIEPKPETSVKIEKPDDYEIQYTESNFVSNFFKHLNSKTEISRFCLQQILLKVYSRVVSPDSHKLRSYKAFTAEVYGELLPSFTSEVLTKVDLRPAQKFYDLGSGVGNTTLQAALEFGAQVSGGCELMGHASYLTNLQDIVLQKKLSVLGLKKLPLTWALSQSFVDNSSVKKVIVDCDVIIVNNYLFDENLNAEVGQLLSGLKPGTKIISLRNFIRPRYKATLNSTIFDYLRVEKHEMSDFLSVSWTANKVPYFISTVQPEICPEYL